MFIGWQSLSTNNATDSFLNFLEIIVHLKFSNLKDICKIKCYAGIFHTFNIKIKTKNLKILSILK